MSFGVFFCESFGAFRGRDPKSLCRNQSEREPYVSFQSPDRGTDLAAWLSW